MIKAIDDFLMNLAKKMISIAAFIGIDRKKLCYLWLAVTIPIWFILGERFTPSHPVINFVISGILILVLVGHVKNNYREDDIFSDRSIGIQSWRLFMTIVYPIIALFFLVPDERYQPSFLRFCYHLPSPFFYWYILLNQSPKKPLRLRNLLKNALGKIKQTFAPAPQPQPSPGPA